MPIFLYSFTRRKLWVFDVISFHEIVKASLFINIAIHTDTHMKRRNMILVVELSSLRTVWLQDMIYFTESGPEEGSLWMCLVQPFTKVPEDAAYVHTVFPATCHIHCWKILYCVPGDFRCCEFILFTLYLMTLSIAQPVQRQEAGWLVNDKLEWMSKTYLPNVTSFKAFVWVEREKSWYKNWGSWHPRQKIINTEP